MAFKFHGVAPKIPTRFHFNVNRAESKKYIGMARKQLSNLKQDMSFRGLRIGNSRNVTEGVLIECYQNFNLSECFVTVPTPSVEVSEVCYPHCLCFPCFSTGIIEKIHTQTDPVHKLGDRQEYDVSICSGYSYDLYENEDIMDTGICSYYEGQPVLVCINYVSEDEITCCDDKKCMVTKIDPEDISLLITPFVIPEMRATHVDDCKR